MSDLNVFIAENTWRAKMDNSKGFDGWNNYRGKFDQADWVVVPGIGRNRDSEIEQESNFETALDMLGGESKNVQVCRFGHWACGWFELILVNPKSKKHVKLAREIEESLDNYPLLDEGDYYEREYEYQSNYADQAKHDLAEALAKHFGLKNNKALIELAYDLNMACQSYYGHDACIDVYTCRKPDTRDLERLKESMKQIEFSSKTSKAFQALAKKLA